MRKSPAQARIAPGQSIRPRAGHGTRLRAGHGTRLCAGKGTRPGGRYGTRLRDALGDARDSRGAALLLAGDQARFQVDDRADPVAVAAVAWRGEAGTTR